MDVPSYDGWDGRFVCLRPFADTSGLQRIPVFHLSLLRNEIFRQIFHCVTVKVNVISLPWIFVICAGLRLTVRRRGPNSWATKFCTVSSSACGCSVWDLLCVRLLDPIILRWLLHFWKMIVFSVVSVVVASFAVILQSKCCSK